jgi:hypothetical protein
VTVAVHLEVLEGKAVVSTALEANKEEAFINTLDSNR